MAPNTRRLTASIALLTLSSLALAQETQQYKYDALGRLISVESDGTVNDGVAKSLCYDDAGNRTTVKSSLTGATATCLETGSPPPPPPPPSNLPPVPTDDAFSVPRCQFVTKNLVSNDTDPEGNYPLSLVSVTGWQATIVSSTSVEIEGDANGGTTYFDYVVQDSLGATATGHVTITNSGPISGCY